jgi:hypothetical protein
LVYRVYDMDWEGIAALFEGATADDVSSEWCVVSGTVVLDESHVHPIARTITS